MKAQLQTKFLAGDVCHLVGGRDQLLPFVVIENFGLSRSPVNQSV